LPLCTHPQLQKNALHYQSIAAGHHVHVGCLAGTKIHLEGLVFQRYHSTVTRACKEGSNPITTIAAESPDSDARHWFKVQEHNGVHLIERGIELFKITI